MSDGAFDVLDETRNENATNRDPRVDPQGGDFLPNYGRTVIKRYGDKVIFGIQVGDSKNCGAYVADLDDWKEWAAGSCEIEYP